MKSVTVALGAIVLLTLGAVPARADKCTGAKLRAVGKKESALLACQARVATAIGVEPACDNRANGKFTTSYSKPGTCGDPDAGVCESIADDCRDALREALPDGNATTPSRCEAARLKVAGKKAAAQLRCYAKAAATKAPVSSVCLAKASAQFLAAFNRVSGCRGDGQAASIESLIDSECVTKLVTVDPTGRVTGICPATTTTTTAAATTTTTSTTTTTAQATTTTTMPAPTTTTSTSATTTTLPVTTTMATRPVTTTTSSTMTTTTATPTTSTTTTQAPTTSTTTTSSNTTTSTSTSTTQAPTTTTTLPTTNSPIFLLDTDESSYITIFQVDPGSGQLTTLGSVPITSGTTLGLAAASDNLLYAVTQSGNVLQIVVSPFGVTTLGNIGANGIVGLAYAGGLLYAEDETNNALYRIQLSPLSSTTVGTIHLSDMSPLTIQGGDLAQDAAGTWYLWTNAAQALYRLDVTTATATPVPAQRTGLGALTGLAVNYLGGGALLGSSGVSAASGAQYELVTLDPNSGATTSAVTFCLNCPTVYQAQFGDLASPLPPTTTTTTSTTTTTTST